MKKRIVNVSSGEAGHTLEILGAIRSGDYFATDESIRRALRTLSGPLEVLINSPGGDAIAGADIYTALRDYSAKGNHVTCRVTGEAASAASLIAMAGDEVIMSPVSTIMIHNPLCLCYGNAAELRTLADSLDTFRSCLVWAYADRTGMSTAEIGAMMDKETMFSAADAVRMGFADSIQDWTRNEKPPKDEDKEPERDEEGEPLPAKTALSALTEANHRMAALRKDAPARDDGQDDALAILRMKLDLI